MNRVSVLALSCVAWVAAAVYPTKAAGTNEPVGGNTNDVADTYGGWWRFVDSSRGRAPYGGVVESLLWDRVVWSRDVSLLMRKTAAELSAKDAKRLMEFHGEISVRTDPGGDVVWIGLSNDVKRVDRISRVLSALNMPELSTPFMPCSVRMSEMIWVVNDKLAAVHKTGRKDMAVAIGRPGWSWEILALWFKCSGCFWSLLTPMCDRTGRQW
jgi:hypothetical protein